VARTNKVGIDYFPFDIDFFQDEKIQFVSSRFGIKGEIIAIRLLCKIYRNGYYTEWNNDTALLFAKGVGDGCQDSCVKDVVYELLKRGFFERSIFERFGILTSRGIQNRYFEATKRYKNVPVNHDFLLINLSNFNNVNINSINVDINPNNVNINPQKKRKRKEKKLVAASAAASRECAKTAAAAFFEKFVDFFNSETNGVFGNVKLPIGEKRKKTILDLIEKYGESSVFESIKIANESDFLKGKNKTGFVATFDWIINPESFDKILSRNYDNARSKKDIEIQSDSKAKLYTYNEICRMWMNGAKQDDFEKREIDGTMYWIRKVDFLNMNLK
jgi:hypothetical protein